MNSEDGSKPWNPDQVSEEREGDPADSDIRENEEETNEDEDEDYDDEDDEIDDGPVRDLNDGEGSYWETEDLTPALLESIADTAARDRCQKAAESANLSTISRLLPQASSPEEHRFLEACRNQLRPETRGGEELLIAEVYFSGAEDLGPAGDGTSVKLWASRLLGVNYYRMVVDGERRSRWRGDRKPLEWWQLMEALTPGSTNGVWGYLDNRWEMQDELSEMDYVVEASVSAWSRFYPYLEERFNDECHDWYEAQRPEAAARALERLLDERCPVDRLARWELEQLQQNTRAAVRGWFEEAQRRIQEPNQAALEGST